MSAQPSRTAAARRKEGRTEGRKNGEPTQGETSAAEAHAAQQQPDNQRQEKPSKDARAARAQHSEARARAQADSRRALIDGAHLAYIEKEPQTASASRTGEPPAERRRRDATAAGKDGAPQRSGARAGKRAASAARAQAAARARAATRSKQPPQLCIEMETNPSTSHEATPRRDQVNRRRKEGQTASGSSRWQRATSSERNGSRQHRQRHGASKQGRTQGRRATQGRTEANRAGQLARPGRSADSSRKMGRDQRKRKEKEAKRKKDIYLLRARLVRDTI